MMRETKDRFFKIRLNEKQLVELKNKADSYGFGGISTYIRFKLFFPASLEEKIEKIYQKVCENNG